MEKYIKEAPSEVKLFLVVFMTIYPIQINFELHNLQTRLI